MADLKWIEFRWSGKPSVWDEWLSKQIESYRGRRPWELHEKREAIARQYQLIKG